MRRIHRYGPRLARRGHPLNGAIWLIGLGVLFYTGHWWPGILVLIGISLVLSAVWKGTDQSADSFGEKNATSFEPARSAPDPFVVTQPSAAPANPASSAPRADLLPANCPRCGAPVRSSEVKWTGTHSAICSYCGSNILAAKK
jgi:DNA-directed RNA polymerase subunit RPC12/RpoP